MPTIKHEHRFEVRIEMPRMKKHDVTVTHFFEGMLQRKSQYKFSDSLSARKIAEQAISRFIEEK